MAFPYIAKANIEDRLSVEVVKQILDDNNDGTADANPVTRVCTDASSYVAGFLRPIYDLDVIAANPPNEVVRLTLDVAHAYLAKRHAEYVRADWEKLLKSARSELVDLRNGVTRLDVVGPPEPAANEGGDVRSGDPLCPTPKPRMFTDGTGDF